MIKASNIEDWHPSAFNVPLQIFDDGFEKSPSIIVIIVIILFVAACFPVIFSLSQTLPFLFLCPLLPLRRTRLVNIFLHVAHVFSLLWSGGWRAVW